MNRLQPEQGYSFVDHTAVSVDELRNSYVYDSNHKQISGVKDVIVTSDRVEKFILDVGGFLGIGAHTVAISPSEIEIHKNNLGDIRIYIPMTKEQLKDLPEYAGKTSTF
ncbi:PRC-barrel domain-containing protein [Desulfonatronum thiosulfatophilum]|uniref:PRC-barrel domain-containing protein n=1 Tax=Desulfonatronum thiosulfatophilum TaxID=617002 RepID=A0A1G6EVS8_9BACT|nr:PRC-barrel domain-containing protein [Desulfonatronum thiosulfatophilum]SDB61508.1 PRC-barrel domain-containing protein [Desulfonatronum thiosulfatophilum]